ncbi:hypothetical protein [Kitasatospora sp. NPDC091207]|uniref:hypothetical protein n=1 Tax=Kitasatospora sp. NPDC091207 TaxID=3364083 RepID=UPI0038203AE5
MVSDRSGVLFGGALPQDPVAQQVVPQPGGPHRPRRTGPAGGENIELFGTGELAHPGSDNPAHSPVLRRPRGKAPVSQPEPAAPADSSITHSA